MIEHHLKRRPTWHRFAVIYCVIVLLLVAGAIKTVLDGHPFRGMHDVPLILFFLAALFTLAATSEMAVTVRWNDRRILKYSRWGNQYLGDKSYEIAIAEIAEISAGYMSNENPGGKPFTLVMITDGTTEIPIHTINYFRDGIQELVADIASLRPDLELPDNLKAYVRGEFDSCWPR